MAEVETVRGAADVESMGPVPIHQRERGVTEDQITTMLVDNPRRYFTGAQS